MENEMHPVEQIAEAVGGTITSAGILPDGSGFATMSMPLPEKHWIYQGDEKQPWGWSNTPPMPFRMGSESRSSILIQSREAVETGSFLGLAQRTFMSRDDFADRIRAAGKYAVRCATMNGKEMDFDPDAMLQNLVVGMLGYWTPDGLSSDEWANPKDGGGANWKPEPHMERSVLPDDMPQATGAAPDFEILGRVPALCDHGVTLDGYCLPCGRIHSA